MRFALSGQMNNKKDGVCRLFLFRLPYPFRSPTFQSESTSK